MPDDPQSPITELAAMAVQHHELYTAYVDAGFTENQALQMLISIIMATIGGAA
ncbi:hypothetical protein ACIO6U_02660 [Streptomyces sp. NPDC087422]|uniref:hypothetical protein n=1 Tax=Streptomyces sp. NPDC087422 TaxID=3365786 RepID=UPI0037FC45DB